MVGFSSLKFQIPALLLAGFVVSANNCMADARKLGLREAVEQALANNLNLKLERQRLDEAGGIALSAEGNFDILLQASAGTGEKKRTPLVAGGANEEVATSWGAGASKTFTTGTRLSFSWDNNQLDTTPQIYLFDPVYSSSMNLELRQPLLQGFGYETQTAQLRAAQKQKEASTYIVKSTSADLAANVIKAYWDLVFSYQDIEVKKVSLRLAKQLLQETQERINAGQLAEVELYRPQSEVARREEGLISAERGIGLAEDRIKVLLNSQEWDDTLQPLDLPDGEIQQFDMHSVLDNTLKNRPDLKAAQLNSEAAEILLHSAQDRTQSTLDLFGVLGISGTDDSYGDTLDNLAENGDTEWQMGVSFSRPLDNSFARGEMVQAKALYEQTVTSTNILKQDIQRAVRATLRDVRLAIKNLEATRKTSLASQKGLEAEQTKFDAGRGTTLDVLVAQETYSNSLSQENLARINYAKTLAELDRIQGIIRLPY